MKTKGRFFWKKGWYSFCSKHYHHDFECKGCNSGTWEYVWIVKISNFIYKVSPGLWIWWNNSKGKNDNRSDKKEF